MQSCLIARIDFDLTSQTWHLCFTLECRGTPAPSRFNHLAELAAAPALADGVAQQEIQSIAKVNRVWCCLARKILCNDRGFGSLLKISHASPTFRDLSLEGPCRTPCG